MIAQVVQSPGKYGVGHAVVRHRILQAVLVHDRPQLRRRQFDARAAQADCGFADAIDIPLPVGSVEAPVCQRLFDAAVFDHAIAPEDRRNRSLAVAALIGTHYIRDAPNQMRPNLATASLMDLNFSMNGIMVCSVLSSSSAFLSTSAARAFGTTATPSSSATMISPGLTRVLAQVTGMLTPAKRK